MQSGELDEGDKILITGPTTGAIYTTLKEPRVNLKPTQQVKKGESFSIKLEEKIRPNDKLYKIVPAHTIEKRKIE